MEEFISICADMSYRMEIQMEKLHFPLSEDGRSYVDVNLLEPFPWIQKRGLVLVVPGGAYMKYTPREGEPVALRFAALGYHTAVLRYRFFPDRHPVPVTDLANAVALIRKNAEDWGIDKKDITICGFSAGGHLCATLGVHWDKPFLHELTGVPGGLVRPDRMILCYPVITTGEYAHKPSIDYLCGDDTKALEFLSLENHVTRMSPPTFLWHTADDPHVPPQNSLLFAEALSRSQVPYALHIYPHGAHGLALADELTCNGNPDFINPVCQSWFQLATEWLKTGEKNIL